MTKEKAKICKKYCGAVAVSWYRNTYTLNAINMLLKRINIASILRRNRLILSRYSPILF